MAAASLCILFACQDLSYKKQDGYVEVTSLRLAEQDIYMSPSGAPSTYQLQVEVLPSNATNRKVKYFIPSQYLGYVTVTETGLLTAHAITGEIKVPLTITSTSNEDAKVGAVITVEETAVKEIRFVQEKVELLYNGESAEIDIRYFPAHAINGRTVTYSVIENVDEKDKGGPVCSVNTDKTTGKTTVTPLRVGQTHIKAQSVSSSGVKCEDYLLVTVDYAKAQFQLQVSETPPPQWTQVVGSYSPISFTLLVLGENTDPNPTISWYVGTSRQVSSQNMRQFTHTPTAVTPITYQVKVKVKAYSQDEVELTSRDIVVYNDFCGFDLRYGNFSKGNKSYQYGETATFSLTEASSLSTVKYQWYLQKLSGENIECFVGETPVYNRDLQRRINVSGDFRLTAKAVDDKNNVVSRTPFTFSAERLMVGDTLVVTPELLGGGLPPDSYSYYLVECDEDGVYDANKKVRLKETASDETFFCLLEKKGFYRLLVTSATNGTPSTVYDPEKGERVAYTCVGEVLRVFDEESEQLYSDDFKTITADTIENLDPLVHIGDTYIFSPFVRGGIELASCRLYVVGCDKDGVFDESEKAEIVSVAGVRTYSPDIYGYFRFILKTTTDIPNSTREYDVERETYVYTYVGDIMKATAVDLLSEKGEKSYAFAVSAAKRVDDIVIEGITVSGKPVLNVHWAPTAGVNRYVAELTFSDGKVVLLDSADVIASFGSNYVYIPSSIASFEDKFRLRVKQKDGIYSEPYYYGTPNAQGVGDKTHILTIGEEAYPYFTEVALGINLYLTSAEETEKLVEYILLNKPSQNIAVTKGNATIEGALYDTYGVTVMPAYALPEWNEENEEEIPDECKKMFEAIKTAIKQSVFDLSGEYTVQANEDGSFTIVFPVKTGRKTVFNTTPTATLGQVRSAFYAEKAYGNVNTASYPSDERNPVYVTSSDQLVEVFERGYRPVPKESDALSSLYKSGLKGLYTLIVGENENDVEKVLAFYDWLTLNVDYDNAAESDLTSASHLLEGVFNQKKACSDGYAKAFSALCGLAGIPCRTYVFENADGKHAYNRVYVNDAYYLVDVSQARGLTRENRLYIDRKFFLMSAEEYRENMSLAAEDFLPETAEESLDWIPIVTTNGKRYVVSTEDELFTLLNSIEAPGTVCVEFACSASGEIATESKLSAVLERLRPKKEIGEMYRTSEVEEGLRVVVFLTDK